MSIPLEAFACSESMYAYAYSLGRSATNPTLSQIRLLPPRTATTAYPFMTCCWLFSRSSSSPWEPFC